MQKIRILFIHHGIGIGGAPISLLNLIKHLDKNRFEIKVASLKRGTHIDLFEREGIETEVIGAPGIYFSHNETGRKQWYYLPYYFLVFLVWLYTAYYAAPKYLKKQKYDIIHLNSHVLTSWAFAARKLGFKVVLHNREAITKGYFGVRYRILKHLIKENCDYIINISKDNEIRLGIKESSCVIYNFIDIPETYRETMSADREERKILYLGGDASIKGFDTVVGCINYLGENIKLFIAGNMGIRKSEKARVRLLPLVRRRNQSSRLSKLKDAQNTIILGTLENPYPLIDECDILITPFKEPHFSRPAIEAFAYGKPVIGSDIMGMDEIINHNENGLLFKRLDAKELAEAINFLCNNSDIAKKMGLNGRKKAIAVFSPEPNMKKIIKVYKIVLGE